MTRTQIQNSEGQAKKAKRIAAAAAGSYHTGIEDLAENHDDHFADSIDAENP